MLNKKNTLKSETKKNNKIKTKENYFKMWQKENLRKLKMAKSKKCHLTSIVS